MITKCCICGEDFLDGIAFEKGEEFLDAIAFLKEDYDFPICENCQYSSQEIFLCAECNTWYECNGDEPYFNGDAEPICFQCYENKICQEDVQKDEYDLEVK